MLLRRGASPIKLEGLSQIMEALIGIGSIGVLATGFIIGLKHALDADHLAAIGTMVTEKRSPWGLALLGGTWGLGHTISLLLVGVIVLSLNLQISERTERILEGFVGFMLIGLGLNVLRKLFTGAKLHSHTHVHNDKNHSHPHIHSDAKRLQPLGIMVPISALVRWLSDWFTDWPEVRV